MADDFLKIDYDNEKKIWKSTNYPYKNLTNRSLGESFLQSMRSLNPEKVLEYHFDEDKEKRVKDLYCESIIIAKNLQRLGIKDGDVVLLFSGYNYMTSSLTFGSILMGGVVNFFEVELENENIDKLFESIQPFMILYEEVFLPKILNSLKRCHPKTLKYLLPIDCFSKTPNVTSELLKSDEIIDFEQFQAIEVEKPELKIAFLVLSSGTTGLPKVAQLSHCSLLNGVYVWWANPYNYEPLNSGSLITSLSPLRWISQVVLLLQSAILGIKRICANKSASGRYCLDILRKTKPTHIFSVPSFFHEVLLELEKDDNESFDFLKFIQLGGEPPSHIIINLCKKYAINSKLFWSYGMSEMSSSITNDINKSGGQLQNGFQMQVLDDNLLQLEHNQYGQLAVKNPYTFMGYKDADNSQCILKNGFFLCGDYGYFDDNNILHVLGRFKDLIKYENVLLIPNLIESWILNLSEIASACMVGYRSSQKDSCEIAALFVVLKPDVTTSHQHISTKIRDFLTAYLTESELSVIHDIHFETSLPLTTCGKINRLELKKFALKKAKLNLNK